MRQASSFTPFDSTSGSGDRSWPASIVGAFNASAFAIPLSLGAVAVVFGRHAPALLPAALLATLLGIALVQLAGLASSRPVLFSSRFLEATTLAALLDAVANRLPAWGIQDTQEARVAALVAIVTGAGLFSALLFALRADRLARYIPTPVFAGFSNSIAVALVLSQAGALARLVQAPGSQVAPMLLVLLVVIGAGLALRRWLPRWPATATAVVIGSLAGLALNAAGFPVVMVGNLASLASLPVMAADFQSFTAPGVPWSQVAGMLLAHSTVLGAVVFLNTSITAQLMSHHDDRPPAHWQSGMLASLAGTVAGLAGGTAISGSAQTSLAGGRRAHIGAPMILCVVLLVVAVACSPVLGWVPMAAVAGVLLVEAAFILDRESVKLLARWVRREPLGAEARENLALVAAVTATAVLLNMVAAVFAGLLLGLVLFAARNARRPVRAVLTGAQVSSHCARSRADLQRLSRHGDGIKVIELDGDLFFGAVQGLERHFNTVLLDARCVVVDWTSVRHVDTSVAEAVRKFQRAAAAQAVALFHVDPSRTAPEVAATLQLKSRGAVLAPDIDHALEAAENHLLRLHGSDSDAPATAAIDAMSIFKGLDEQERLLLEEQMPQRLHRAGEVVLSAGEPGDELMVVMQGSASILVPDADGAMVRLAGVRRGAVLGEMAFLDRAARSATVVAQEDLAVAVLTRSQFDQLSASQPRLIQKLLANLALDLAARLRHTNRLASARQARR